MDRRSFLKTVGLGAAAAAINGRSSLLAAVQDSNAVKAEGSGPRPNIIVILADDLGWGDLSCYPQDPRFPDATIRTPNLDSLAAEGARCTQGYATCMVCAPSRAGLLTGRYQQQFGFFEFKETLAGIPKNEMMLQEYLKTQGYATACVGKWHLGYKPELGPLARGFDRFYGFRGGQHDYFDRTLGDPIHAFSLDHDAFIMDQDKPVEKIEYLTDEFTNQSLKFIDQQAAAKTPFFLYLAYSAPHPPMQSTWEDLKPYADGRGGTFNVRDIARAMIDSLDRNIGKLLNRLMHLGIDKNTLIVFSSDNGGADDGDGVTGRLVQHNGGLRARKGFYWEGGIRVPFIVRWPGKVPEGVVYDRPVSQLDIYATAVAAAGGCKMPKKLDGTDLVPYLAGAKSGTPHEVLYWGLDPGLRWAVRKGKWKLTYDYVDCQTTYDKTFKMVTELHDVEADPYERNNVIEKYPEIAAELTRLKDEFYRTVPPTLATPKLMKEWQEEMALRKKKTPNADALRKDGAPGHGL